MDDSAARHSGGARIVVLSQDSSLAWSTNGRGIGVVLARTESGYEAAAELLAAPAAALVVDLRLLGGKHLRLLEIARSLGVEVLAVGSLPIGMSAEDLSQVRLIARRDLPRALEALVRSPQGGGVVGDSPPEAPARPADRLPESPPADGVRLAPAKVAEDDPDQNRVVLTGEELPVEIGQALQGSPRRSRGSQARRSDDDEPPGSQGEAQAQAPDAPGQGRSNGGAASVEGQGQSLLTPEELNALLGDE